MNLKKMLRMIRVDLDITQVQMANDLGVSQSHLSHAERGERKLSDSVIDKLYNCYEQYIDVDLRVLAIVHNQEMDLVNLPDYQRELLAELRFVLLSEYQCEKIKELIK
ncbi:transcriptional regulator/repressor [Proteus phage 2207-N35]|nr:transcriptional regulator/repressor [Proteus phage 2207-N35]